MSILKKWLGFIILCATMNIACAQNFDNLSPEASSQLIKANENNAHFVILDVRTPDEFSQGRLKNSMNLDLYNPSFAIELNKLDKNKTYLVYCRSGRRSASAATQMEVLGFSKVSNMLGGMTQWMQEGRPVEK